MKIILDDLDPNRYWAIARENWKTLDSFGSVVYHDNSFQFYIFDFTTDGVLKNFKIFYRLWFYEYQYDDIELGIKRNEKLKNDIVKYFNNSLKSVPDRVKKTMFDFLVAQNRESMSTTNPKGDYKNHQTDTIPSTKVTTKP
jgi:hypothetical protein